MGEFRAIVIERSGGRYHLTRDGELLLAVPESVFERFDTQTPFPLEWAYREESHPVRRLFWNPRTAEFLMGGLEAHPARFVEGSGSSAFRSYLHGLWLPTPPTLLLRPYWNPEDPYEPFDRAARIESFRIQWRFRELLRGLRPPDGWTTVFNAVDEYLDALGASVEGPDSELRHGIRELSLTPPAPVGDPRTVELLEALTADLSGESFAVVRAETLVGLHALGLPELQAAEAFLGSRGLLCQEGVFRPH